MDGGFGFRFLIFSCFCQGWGLKGLGIQDGWGGLRLELEFMISVENKFLVAEEPQTTCNKMVVPNKNCFLAKDLDSQKSRRLATTI